MTAINIKSFKSQLDSEKLSLVIDKFPNYKLFIQNFVIFSLMLQKKKKKNSEAIVILFRFFVSKSSPSVAAHRSSIIF